MRRAQESLFFGKQNAASLLFEFLPGSARVTWFVYF